MPKILIVDDEKKVRDIYHKLLAFEKYQVLEAEDVPSATKLLVDDADIRLVLLDINIPQVDGGILFRLIRMLDEKIKVIVTSVYPLEEQKRLIPGALDYYDKSEGLSILIQKIRSALKRTSDEKDYNYPTLN